MSTNQSFNHDSSTNSIGSKSTQLLFEEMVRKVIMDMMSDGVVSDSTSTATSTGGPIKSELSHSSLLRKKKSLRRRSKTRRLPPLIKEVSIMSLVNEVSEEFDGDTPGNSKQQSRGRKSKSEGKKKKKKKQSFDNGKKKRKSKVKRRGRSVSPLSSRSPIPKGRTSTKGIKLRIGEVLDDLYEMYPDSGEEQSQSSVDTLRTSNHSGLSSRSGGSTISKPGSRQFYQEMASKLHTHRNIFCIQDATKYEDTNTSEVDSNNNDQEEVTSEIDDFVAAFDPNEMRCLALVSHNEMKGTMKEFVVKNKNILKKFRLTGTQSTMHMLGEVFKGEDNVVFGPACSSGPLGGDAELVAMMASGQLGGIIFFQDPMTSHPHQCDIKCLLRQALVHNTVIATTPTTAMGIMEVLQLALKGNGRPELLPSFFLSLQSPTVEAYKKRQAKVIESRASA